MDNYILIDGEPVRCSNLETWGRWFHNIENRRVEETQVREGVSVSTVFLGTDHNYSGGKPILWETMIFGGEHHGYQMRYHTEAEARAGHKKAVLMATTARTYLTFTDEEREVQLLKSLDSPRRPWTKEDAEKMKQTLLSRVAEREKNNKEGDDGTL